MGKKILLLIIAVNSPDHLSVIRYRSEVRSVNYQQVCRSWVRSYTLLGFSMAEQTELGEVLGVSASAGVVGHEEGVYSKCFVSKLFVIVIVTLDYTT